MFHFVQFYSVSDSDFRGPVTNRFIMIYCKRDEDGTKRKLHQSPEISQPSGCTLARKWGLVETKQNREVLPNFYYTYRHRAGIARLMGPFETKQGDRVVNVDF